MRNLPRQRAHHRRGFGLASCDACHTRHTFSIAEARSPQACQTCHMGFDHPQWTADRVAIRQALGVLDPAGKPTARLDVVKADDVARLDQASWQKERDGMLATCGGCHSAAYAKEQLAKSVDMIRQADHLMARGIQTVAALCQDGLLPGPKTYAAAFPDLLTFHDAPMVIEQKLFVRFLEHRMRAFQGSFHASDDYAMWYGWSELQRDLTEIKELAADLRRAHGKVAPAKAGAAPARQPVPAAKRP